jgi:transcriptional regulator ATRX
MEYYPRHGFRISLSTKMLMLVHIIKYCEKAGDKLLVFSQSLETLTYIEDCLKYLAPKWYHGDEKEGHVRTWKINEDYIRIDGHVSSSSRDEYNKLFNKAANKCTLMLISKLAGSEGTNMIGANRVVLFDTSWNPAHDIQSIFRAYRIGQEKRVYIYRLITTGTMEEVIYNRQVVKEATSLRVIDDKYIENHFNSTEIDNLYKPPKQSDSQSEFVDNFDDQLVTTLYDDHKKFIVKIISHDSFFNQDKSDDMDIILADSVQGSVMEDSEADDSDKESTENDEEYRDSEEDESESEEENEDESDEEY